MTVPTDINAPLSNPSHTAEHQRVSDAIAALAPGWIALPFTSAANYGSLFELCAYRKIGDIVYLQGLLNTTAAIGANAAFATLPVGYRPKRQHIVICATALATAMQRVDVQTDGVLQCASALPINTWLSLSGIQFSTTGL